jgi:serine protease
MTLPSTLRQLVVSVGAGFALAIFPASASVAKRGVDRATAAPVHGLIVQLRDAPSHVELAREKALAQGGLAPRERARWQRLLDSADVKRESPSAAHRHPVGARAQLLRFDRPLSAAEAEKLAARLAAQPDVAWVVPNEREHRLQVPNDPLYAATLVEDGQWWLRPVSGSNSNSLRDRLRGVPGFQTAWLRSTGSSNAVVAVLDTGITVHPELVGRTLQGYDFVSEPAYANDTDGRDNDPSDPGDWVSADDRMRDPTNFKDCEVEPSSWHGTVNAGIVAALTDNGEGVAAANWNGRVLPVRVAGKCGASVADIVDGMRWAVGLDVCKRANNVGTCVEFYAKPSVAARIVNISFGSDKPCNDLYQSAVNDLLAVGAVVVAAAGNQHASSPSRPANCANVIGVTALNRDGFKSNYSNFGNAIVLSTVGGDDFDSEASWNALADSGIRAITNNGTTTPGAHGYAYQYGTSFAAPIVSSALSLMLSVNMSLTPSELVAGLRASARKHVTTTVPGFNACSNSNPGRCICTTSTCGAGILDVDQALIYAANPNSYPAPAPLGADVSTGELVLLAAIGPDRQPNPEPPPSSPSGGGGAMSAGWLLALACATLALRGPVSATAWRAPLLRRFRMRRSRRPTRHF